MSDYKIVNSPSFYQAVNAVSQFLMAFAGVPAYFPIAAEMRDPHRYTRSLLLCQGFVTAVYVTIGCVVYFYCGSYVSTPALGSAGKTLKKVSYGLAIPGLLATTVLSIHVSNQSFFLAPQTALTIREVCKQEYLYPSLARIRAPHGQHDQALGNMVRMHFLSCSGGLYYCQ